MSENVFAVSQLCAKKNLSVEVSDLFNSIMDKNRCSAE